MSERIEVGDLVVLVRGHSCLLRAKGGAVFVVSGLLTPIGGGWHCHTCGARSLEPTEIGAEGLGRRGTAIPLSFLRKIPPLAELEDIERREEIPA